MEYPSSVIFRIADWRGDSRHHLSNAHNDPFRVSPEQSSTSLNHDADCSKHRDESSSEKDADFSDDGDAQSSIPYDFSSELHLAFTFDSKTKHAKKFTFGSDPEQCDVYLGPRGCKISPVHFVIYFDGLHWRLDDNSSHGTSVSWTSSTIGSTPRRTRYSWLLPDISEEEREESRNIEIYISVGRRRFRIRFRLVFANQPVTAADRLLHFHRLENFCSSSELPRVVGIQDKPCYYMGESHYNHMREERKVIDMSTGTMYTARYAKHYSKYRSRPKSGDQINRWKQALEMLKLLRHENLVKLVDIQSDFVVMDCDGNRTLRKYLVENDSLSRHENFNLLDQGLMAIIYHHANGVRHNDISPSNVVISSQRPFTIKLMEVELPMAEVDDLPRFTSWGSNIYVPPATLSDCNSMAYPPLGNSKHLADIWALGIVSCQCILGLPLLSDDLHEDLAWGLKFFSALYRVRTSGITTAFLYRYMVGDEFATRYSPRDCLRALHQTKTLLLSDSKTDVSPWLANAFGDRIYCQKRLGKAKEIREKIRPPITAAAENVHSPLKRPREDSSEANPSKRQRRMRFADPEVRPSTSSGPHESEPREAEPNVPGNKDAELDGAKSKGSERDSTVPNEFEPYGTEHREAEATISEINALEAERPKINETDIDRAESDGVDLLGAEPARLNPAAINLSELSEKQLNSISPGLSLAMLNAPVPNPTLLRPKDPNRTKSDATGLGLANLNLTATSPTNPDPPNPSSTSSSEFRPFWATTSPQSDSSEADRDEEQPCTDDLADILRCICSIVKLQRRMKDSEFCDSFVRSPDRPGTPPERVSF